MPQLSAVHTRPYHWMQSLMKTFLRNSCMWLSFIFELSDENPAFSKVINDVLYYFMSRLLVALSCWYFINNFLFKFSNVFEWLEKLSWKMFLRWYGAVPANRVNYLYKVFNWTLLDTSWYEVHEWFNNIKTMKNIFIVRSIHLDVKKELYERVVVTTVRWRVEWKFLIWGSEFWRWSFYGA